MLRIQVYTSALFLLLSTLSCQAKVGMPPDLPVGWLERTYQTKLPDPFGVVRLYIHVDSSQKIQVLKVELEGSSLTVDPTLFVDLENPGEPEIVIDANYAVRSEPIDEFKILFEYGGPVRDELEPFPGCDSPCYEWTRRVFIITVNKNREIEISEGKTTIPSSSH